MTAPQVRRGPSDATVAKAGRIIAAGGVHVDYTEPAKAVIGALVTSETGAKYAVRHNPGEGWWCSCPSRWTCSHILAVTFVAADDHEFNIGDLA